MVYKIKANKIDSNLVKKIKKSFGEKEVFILDENELELLTSISNIEQGKNLITFTPEEFDKYVEKKLK